MLDKLVLLASFNLPIEAHLAKTRLEWEGVECFVFDEYIINMNWLYSNAVGGAKLLVRKPEVQSATDILQRISGPPEIEKGNAGDKPREKEHYERLSRRLFFICWLLSIAAGGYSNPLFLAGVLFAIAYKQKATKIY